MFNLNCFKQSQDAVFFINKGNYHAWWNHGRPLTRIISKFEHHKEPTFDSKTKGWFLSDLADLVDVRITSRTNWVIIEHSIEHHLIKVKEIVLTSLTTLGPMLNMGEKNPHSSELKLVFLTMDQRLNESQPVATVHWTSLHLKCTTPAKHTLLWLAYT